MLKSLHVRQFTVFRDSEFQFSESLNVIVGNNGTGKTQLLKLGYLFCSASPDLTAKRSRLTDQRVQAYFDERLVGLFRVAEIGSLIRLGHKNGATLRCTVEAVVPFLHIRLAHEPKVTSRALTQQLAWEIQLKRSKADVANVVATRVPDDAPVNVVVPHPVFIPSKEMVSLFKGLIALFEKFREFPLDETYRDLAVAMSSLQPREQTLLALEAIQRLQLIIGGDLKMENGDLVFERSDGAAMELQLMAEGHRKLAMLVYLLRYGAIEVGGTLFWDEPEANLNPAALKLLAQALFELSTLGVQVIVATHSLFLLREFEILQMRGQGNRPKTRYFGLGLTRGHVEVSQSDDIADIDPLLMLDENLDQSDRYVEADR